MRISIVLVLTALLLFSFCNTALAIEDDIGQSKIHPASPLYFLKSAKEILELKFTKTTQQKALKYFEFAERRIREVKALSKFNHPDLIPPVLERYWSYLNRSSNLLSFGGTEGDQVLDQIGKHLIVLEGLQTDHPKAKIAIRALIYRISDWNSSFLKKLPDDVRKQLASKITANQSIACKFLSKEASSSSLNQTEKAVYIQRTQKCYDSLNLSSFGN